MDIYVYSDESGVFDKVHNEYFVFGGLIFLSKFQKDIESRKYSHVEKTIRSNYRENQELKASVISNKDKGKIYRSLNGCIKFAAVVRQGMVNNNIYAHKKTKQRYLDYVYKITLKRAFQKLIADKRINPNDVENIYIFCDEHATATDGKYELREALEQEFKLGTFNFDYGKYYPPIFAQMKHIDLCFKDSRTNVLVRAADIVANKIYHEVISGNMGIDSKNISIALFP